MMTGLHPEDFLSPPGGEGKPKHQMVYLPPI